MGARKTDDSRNLGDWPCREAEWAAIDTARAHIDSAKLLYAHRQWAQACFFAMTAIELIGKALQFQRVWTAYETRDEDPERYQIACADLRSGAHWIKATQGAVATLILNDEARKRHGTNSATGLPRIDAVRYIAEADGEWMNLRNACLYVDLGVRLGSPLNAITRNHAYLMIVGVLEVLAKYFQPFFTYRNRPEFDITDSAARPDDSKARAVLEEIGTFSLAERVHVDLDRLPEIGHAERVVELKRKVRQQRDTLGEEGRNG